MTSEITQSEPTGALRTEIDEDGVSWVVIDDEAWEHAQVQDWIGGIPDVWKRR